MSAGEPDPYRTLREQLQRLDQAATGGHAPISSPLPAAAPEQDPAGDLTVMARRRTDVREPRKPQPTSEAPPAAELIVADADQAPRTVDTALRRIAAHDGALNAFNFVDGVAAREAARSMPTGPLAGWPIGHKDILLTAGQPTTAGSDLLRHHVPREDATVVVRLRDAGAISVGKLATHEFASGITGTVSAFGPTHNPWDTTRIAGGSSCGSAAAVAAGLVRAATGTDTGGSVRIPAACCGVVGFKPTCGTVPTRGVIPFSWTLDHVGPIARTVEDARRMLEVMRGGSVEQPATGPLRVGLTRDLLATCRPEVADALEAMAADLQRLGHRVEALALEPGLFDVAPVAAALFLAEGLAYHADCLRRWPGRYQPQTVRLLECGRAVTGVRYVQALRLRRRLIAYLDRVLRDVDLILCPALPMTAPPAATETVELPEGALDVRAALTRFTRPFNVSGLPALVVPCGADDAGLPIAAQLVGRHGEDRRVLDTGAAYQRATAWLRWPPLAAGAD